VAFSPEGRRLASAGNDGTIKVWNISMQQEAGALIEGIPHVYCLALSVAGERLATCRSASVEVWDIRTGKLIYTLSLPGGRQVYVASMVFSPDGQYLGAATNRQDVLLWDMKTAAVIPVQFRQAGRIVGLAFSSEDQQLRVLAGSDLVKLWDARTGTELATLAHNTGKISGVVFNPDRRLFATTHEDGKVRLWDAKTGQVFRVINAHTAEVTTVAFSQDSRYLASGTSDGTLKIWDVNTGRATALLQGHAQCVTSIVFSPDGRRLVSGSNELTIKLWDTETGHLALVLRGHEQKILSVAFSSDGQKLFSSDEGGNLKVWDAQGPNQKAKAAVLGGEKSLLAKWHEDEASSGAKAGQWFGVVFHLTGLIEREPGQGRVHRRRGYALAELGQWEKATADYAKAIDLEGNQWEAWHGQAWLCLQRGDMTGYRRTCAGLLERLGSTDNPDTAHWVARTCVLSGDAVVDRTRPVQLGEKGATGRSTDFSYHNTLGAALYRAGDFKGSIERLKKAIEVDSKGGSYYTWIFLAMAHHRLGQVDEAQKWLDQAVQWFEFDTVRQEKSENPGAPWRTWEQRLEIQLLRQEAEALLQRSGRSSTARPSRGATGGLLP
jgi:WD40 repeat protein